MINSSEREMDIHYFILLIVLINLVLSCLSLYLLIIQDAHKEFAVIGTTMVLILDRNSERGAHVRNNLGYLIFKRHLIT